MEKLVQFVTCKSVTGAQICHEIRSTLKALNIDEQACRAQGYDGAGAMSGHLNGCQANFRSAVPQAHYYHCGSHQLNLALTKSCQIRNVQCMLSDLKAIGLFFKFSPKRQRCLEQSIQIKNEKRSEAGEEPIRTLEVEATL